MKQTSHDRELELSVLRAVLFNPGAVHGVLRFSDDPDFFYDPALKMVWRAMIDLSSEGKAIDVTLLSSNITRKGYGSQSQVDDIFDEVRAARESDAHLDDWCQELLSYYQERELESLSGDINRRLNSDDTAAEVCEFISRRIVELSGVAGRSNLGTALDDVLATIYAHQHSGILRQGISTHLQPLNELTGGLGKNWLTVVGAVPGAGKTSLAMEIMDHAIQYTPDLHGLVISLEMSPEQLAERTLAHNSGIPFSRIIQGDLDDLEMAACLKAKEVEMDYTHRISIVTQSDFSGRITADKIYSTVVAENMRAGGKLGLVVVDYFQLISAPTLEDKEEAVRTINRISKSLGIPVILVSQLTRYKDSRPPSMQDLKSTSQLEQDADLILLLDRKDRRVDESRWIIEEVEENKVDFIVGKFRHGPEKDFHAYFYGENFIFSPQPIGLLSSINTPFPFITSSDAGMGDILAHDEDEYDEFVR